jgi:hypothetical protein
MACTVDACATPLPPLSTMDFTDLGPGCVASAILIPTSVGQAEAPCLAAVQSEQMQTAQLSLSDTEDISDEGQWSQVLSKKATATKPKVLMEGEFYPTSTPIRPKAVVNSAQSVDNGLVNSQKTFKFEGDAGRDSRKFRTATVTLPPKGAIYTRALFVNHLKELDCLKSLEACGPTSAPHIWQFTFEDENYRSKFEKAGNFSIGEGLEARIRLPKPKSLKVLIRCHWAPYHVPMHAIADQINSMYGLKVISAKYETARIEGMEHVRSLVRAIVVETYNIDYIPYFMVWKHQGETGKVLITMRGRDPICLKCLVPGHLGKDCKAIGCIHCNSKKHGHEACPKKSQPKTWANLFAPPPAIDMEVEGGILPEDIETPNQDAQGVNGPQPELEGEAHDAEVLGSVQPPIVSTLEVSDTGLMLADPLPSVQTEQISVSGEIALESTIVPLASEDSRSSLNEIDENDSNRSSIFSQIDESFVPTEASEISMTNVTVLETDHSVIETDSVDTVAAVNPNKREAPSPSSQNSKAGGRKKKKPLNKVRKNFNSPGEGGNLKLN